MLTPVQRTRRLVRKLAYKNTQKGEYLSFNRGIMTTVNYYFLVNRKQYLSSISRTLCLIECRVARKISVISEQNFFDCYSIKTAFFSQFWKRNSSRYGFRLPNLRPTLQIWIPYTLTRSPTGRNWNVIPLN